MKETFKKIKPLQLLFIILLISTFTLISVSTAKYVIDLGVIGSFTLDIEPSGTLPTATEFRTNITNAVTTAKQGTLRMVVFGKWDPVNGYTDAERDVLIPVGEWVNGNNVDPFGGIKVFVRKNTNLNGSTAYILSEKDIIAPVDSNGLFSAANDATFRYVQYIIFDNFHLPETDVFYAQDMFRSCTALKELDVSFLASHKGKFMLNGTFYNCTSLTRLDISSIDFSKCSKASFDPGLTFSNLSKLDYLDISDTTWSGGLMEWLYPATNTRIIDMTNIHTDSVTQIDDLFNSWSKLEEIKGFSSFNAANLEHFEQTFVGCESLPDKYFDEFAAILEKGNNVTHCYEAFVGCKNLTAPTAQRLLNAISSNNLSTIHGIFKSCTGISGKIDMSVLNTGSVTDMRELFKGCTGISSLNLSGLNTAKVTDMTNMFSGCSKLTTILIDNTWNTEKVTSSSGMFTGCTTLVGEKGTTYSSSHTDKTYARRDGGPDSATPGYLTHINAFSNRIQLVNTKEEFDALCATVLADFKLKFDNPSVNNDPYDLMMAEVASLGINEDGYDSGPRFSLDTIYDTYRKHMAASQYPIENLPSPAGIYIKQNSWIQKVVFTTLSNFNELKATGQITPHYNVDILPLDDSNSGGVQLYIDEGSWELMPSCMYFIVNDRYFDTMIAPESISGLFQGFNELEEVYFNGLLDVSGVTDFSNMFAGCNQLEAIYVGAGEDWSTIDATDTGMFDGCTKLKGGSGTQYNDEQTDLTYARIDGGTEKPGYFTEMAS